MSTTPLIPTPKRIDQPIFQLPGVCDRAVANLIVAFRGFPLLPVPIGATAKDIQSLPVPLAVVAASPDYPHRLCCSSIAVALESGGLTAICFARRESLLMFLQRNLGLADTLITAQPGEFVVWVKAQTAHRRSLSTPALSVRMIGNVLVFNRAATAQPSYFLTPASPVKADLESIDWGPDPDGQIAAWLVRLRHGEFFRRNRRAAMTADVGAWTEFLARRLKADLQYHRLDRSFFARDAESEGWIAMGDAAVASRVMEVIRSAPVSPEAAKAGIDDQWVLSMLLPRLRAALIADPVPADPFVRLFLQEAIVAEKGSNFTLKEFCLAYDHIRQIRGWLAFSHWDLAKSVRRLMAGPPYLKRLSKSIPRDNGNNDGYRGFALRLLPEAETGDVR